MAGRRLRTRHPWVLSTSSAGRRPPELLPRGWARGARHVIQSVASASLSRWQRPGSLLLGDSVVGELTSISNFSLDCGILRFGHQARLLPLVRELASLRGRKRDSGETVANCWPRGLCTPVRCSLACVRVCGKRCFYYSSNFDLGRRCSPGSGTRRVGARAPCSPTL